MATERSPVVPGSADSGRVGDCIEVVKTMKLYDDTLHDLAAGVREPDPDRAVDRSSRLPGASGDRISLSSTGGSRRAPVRARN